MSADSPPAPGNDAQQAPSLVGQTLDNRYRITRKLGEGGMGEVYAADHIHIERSYAIKLLRPEIVSNPEAVTRFRQEARSSSSIGHQNIIRIDDFGQLTDGRIYMCMELLNGAALNDMLAQPTPLPVDRLLNILIQTGHGLAAAHARGIIHRDMKPENVFVTVGPNGEDIPKILDFGIAKVAGNDGQNHLTRTGTIFGTPFYMAPEQALGNQVDARTDIYAVGVIMYECFAGSLPFQGDSFMGILTQHITTEPEPVAQRAAKAGRPLPPGLAEVITRCMQKNPAQRFATMDDLVNTLIQIYRGVAGAGMSTYMEAFSGMSAGQSVPQTGALGVGGAPLSSGQINTPHNASGSQPNIFPPSNPGSQPNIYATPNPNASTPMPMSGAYVSPSAQAGVIGGVPYSASQSQPVLVPPKKSKAGLIIGLVLAAAAIAAVVVVVVTRKPDVGPGPGSDHGSGSQGSGIIASGGQDAGALVPPPNAVDAGQVAVAPADASQVAVATPDAAEVAAAIDAGAPAADQVRVLLLSHNVAAFDIYENGSKILDGPSEITVPKGDTRTVVLKAKGFKDKTVTVEGIVDKKDPDGVKRLTVALDRVPAPPVNPVNPPVNPVNPTHPEHPDPYTNPNNPPPVNPTHFPPNDGHDGRLDCSARLVDSHSRHCVRQYCARHPEDGKCQVE
jgi:serine/threonine-protein kinase